MTQHSVKLHWCLREIYRSSWSQWRCGVVVITTAQLHSTKPELRLCAGSNLARSVSEIRDSGDLWQWSQLEIRLKVFRQSTIPQKQFIIITVVQAYNLRQSISSKSGQEFKALMSAFVYFFSQLLHYFLVGTMGFSLFLDRNLRLSTLFIHVIIQK